MRTSYGKSKEILEKTFETDFRQVYRKFNSGELTGNGHYDELGKDYTRTFLAAYEEKFKTDKGKTPESLQTAHRLAFIQCVGSRDRRFTIPLLGFLLHAFR